MVCTPFPFAFLVMSLLVLIGIPPTLGEDSPWWVGGATVLPPLCCSPSLTNPGTRGRDPIPFGTQRAIPQVVARLDR